GWNGGTGIVVGSAIEGIGSSSLSGCTVTKNGGDGINVRFGCVITECSAFQNGGDGIFAGGSSTVDKCDVRNSGGDGIEMGNGNGVVRDSNSGVNAGDGIKVLASCLISGNRCEFNSSGIHATGSNNRIEGNHVLSNTRGVKVDSSDNLIIRNSARNNITANYDIVANNNVGTTVTALHSGAISGSDGGVGLGTTDPWANFSF
ncbi:MAG: hypothetical protein V2A74_12950, partial [bacterium]